MKITVISTDPVVKKKLLPHLSDVRTEKDALIGELEEELVTEKRTGTIENQREKTSWVEYYIMGEKELVLVHRSAHVTLLKLPEASGSAASFNGGPRG